MPPWDCGVVRQPDQALSQNIQGAADFSLREA